MKIIVFGNTKMGVETPIPPIWMNAAAPKRDAPAADQNDSKKLVFYAKSYWINLIAPPYLKRGPEAGDLVNTIFMLRVRTPVHVRFYRALIDSSSSRNPGIRPSKNEPECHSNLAPARKPVGSCISKKPSLKDLLQFSLAKETPAEFP
jgi:hypothetical protein